MNLQDQMFCGYMIFLSETVKDRKEFAEKAVEAVQGYLYNKGLEYPE